MNTPKNLKVGDKFQLKEDEGYFFKGEVVELQEVIENSFMWFKVLNSGTRYSFCFEELKPLVDDINNPYVGMELIDNNVGFSTTVLAVCGEMVALSYDDKVTFNFWVTKEELKEMYEVKTTIQKKTLTKKEIADKFQVGVDELEIVE